MSPSFNDSQAVDGVGIVRFGRFLPLLETMRLYAGWLLAWYFFVFAIGGYQLTHSLPFDLPFIDELVTSSVAITVSFGCLLLLLLSSIRKMLPKNLLLSIVFFLLWIGAVVFFGLNA